MAEWCAENLRDCQAWIDEGLELSTTSNEAAKFYDATVRQLVSWMECEQLGGFDKSLATMIDADPKMLMGRSLSLFLECFGTGSRLNEESRSKRQKLLIDAKQYGKKREQRHALAVNYFGDGEITSAVVEWEKILAEHPNDLLAIKLSQDGYYWLGRSYDMRNSMARIIDKWDKNKPCYSYLHGMYAFGLEESGDYEKAEQHAKKGLSLQPKDCWSTHALAHCMDMTGRHKDGIRFMESTKSDWEPCAMLALHNYWHSALFYVEIGDFETVLTLYDNEIEKRSTFGYVDAASLLCRLELEGVDAGDRWKKLISVVEPHIDDHFLAFTDAHIPMVLSRYKEGNETLEKFHKSVSSFITSGSGDQKRLHRDLGEDICYAISEFNHGNYTSCFDRLYPIRNEIFQIGGSHTQRDIFTQILIHAALRSNNTEVHRMAIPLIEERNKVRPNSMLAARLAAHQKTSHMRSDVNQNDNKRLRLSDDDF